MKKKLISLFLLTTLIFNTFIIDVSAAYPTDAEIIAAAADVIVSSEGWYSSVRADDNGAVSIGCIQWHANRALNLLKTIVNANTSAALDILGDALYNEIVTSTSWTTRVLTEEEASKVSKLISTPEGIAAQDALLANDIANYVAHGRQLGITSPAALVYFADVENQCGGGGSARVYKAAVALSPNGNVDLDILHQAALADGPAGKFPARRNKVYNYALLLGWEDDDLSLPYELWSTTETLNVRTGPGLSYQVTGSIAKGTTVIIYDRIAADGYVWGKTTSGWIATDYCTFISSTKTYYANFDVNGGTPFASPLLSLEVDSFNEGIGSLQVYSSAFGVTTETFSSHKEIVVSADGVALNTINNGTNNNQIPQGGLVIAASGSKRLQLQSIVSEGHYISFNRNKMIIEVYDDINAYRAASTNFSIGSAAGKLPTPAPSDPSLYFAGWYTDGGLKLTANTIITLNMTSNLTFYAKWSTESGDYYEIDFDVNGGTISSSHPQYTLKVNSINGKRLANYIVVYDGTAGTTTGANIYGTEVAVDKTGKVLNAPLYNIGNSIIPEGGFVISAHDSGTTGSSCIAVMNSITTNSYVYFDSNNMTLEIYDSYESFTVSRKKVCQGKPIGALPSATKDGYIFTGWYSANGGLITENTIYTSDLSTVFKAGWQTEAPTPVTVFLDANGGTVYPNEITVYEGNSIGTLPVPARDRYNFMGWYDINGTLVTSETVYSANMSTSFTAIWEEKTAGPVTVTVTLDTNGGGFYKNELSSTYVADGLNCYRNTDMLVVYDNNRGENTLTNRYGIEAIVGADGIVKEIQSYVGKAVIPAGGFVLSGHGAADKWILSNVLVGDHVTFDYSTNTISVYKTKVYTSHSLSVTSGNTIGELPVPIRETLIFHGWHTEAGQLITSSTVSDFTTDTTLYAKWYAFGDINGDLVIDESDMNLLKNAVTTTSEFDFNNCDLNGDGLVNLEDYFVLYNILYN